MQQGDIPEVELQQCHPAAARPRAIRVLLADDQALVRVADTGIGISPDDQVRLFEKFYRVKRRDTVGIQGTGLGLAIVKSIVERHGGRVWVDSELDQGSVFCISLPIGEAEAPEVGVPQ